MTPETIFVLYINLCAVAFGGWRHARRHAAASQSWRAVACLSLIAFVLLLTAGGLFFTMLLLMAMTWHGC